MRVGQASRASIGGFGVLAFISLEVLELHYTEANHCERTGLPFGGADTDVFPNSHLL